MGAAAKMVWIAGAIALAATCLGSGVGAGGAVVTTNHDFGNTASAACYDTILEAVTSSSSAETIIDVFSPYGARNPLVVDVDLCLGNGSEPTSWVDATAGHLPFQRWRLGARALFLDDDYNWWLWMLSLGVLRSRLAGNLQVAVPLRPGECQGADMGLVAARLLLSLPAQVTENHAPESGMGEMMVYACRRDGDQICYGRPKHGDGSWPLRFMSPGSPPTMTAFALSCATSVALVAGFLCLVAAVPLSVVRAVAGVALPDDLHIRSDGLTLAALTLAASLCGMALWFAFYAALQRAWSLAWILLCPLGGVAILAAVGLWGYVEGEYRAPFYQPRAVGDATRGLISVGFGMIFAPFLAAIPGWIVALYFHRIQSLSCLLELALAVGYSTLIAGRVLVWWTSPVSTITSVFLARLDEAVEQAAAKGQVFAFDRTAPARLWSGDQELDDDELAHLNFRLAFRSVHAGDAARTLEVRRLLAAEVEQAFDPERHADGWCVFPAATVAGASQGSGTVDVAAAGDVAAADGRLFRFDVEDLGGAAPHHAEAVRVSNLLLVGLPIMELVGLAFVSVVVNLWILETGFVVATGETLPTVLMFVFSAGFRVWSQSGPGARHRRVVANTKTHRKRE